MHSESKRHRPGEKNLTKKTTLSCHPIRAQCHHPSSKQTETMISLWGPSPSRCRYGFYSLSSPDLILTLTCVRCMNPSPLCHLSCPLSGRCRPFFASPPPTAAVVSRVNMFYCLDCFTGCVCELEPSSTSYCVHLAWASSARPCLNSLTRSHPPAPIQ